jgi:hypothetical protein
MDVDMKKLLAISCGMNIVNADGSLKSLKALKRSV